MFSKDEGLQNLMKVSVAGTGFASFVCIKYLVSLGIKPIVFDINKHASNENKMSIKTKSIVGNYDEYLSLGGLSNLWTGVIEEYLQNDFINWPFSKKDLDPYYKEVIKLLDFAEIHSFYSQENTDLLNYQISKNQDFEKREIYKDQNFSLKFASLLSNKLNNSNDKNYYFDSLCPLRLKENVNQLIKESKIEYRNEKIIKITENNNDVIIYTKNNNHEKRFVCDYLFAGCGAISSYLILKNSFPNFDKKIKIKSSKKIVVPVKFKNLNNFNKKFFNTFPIMQLNDLQNQNLSIYSQIYNLNPNIINYFFPKINNFKKYLFLISFFKNFGFSYFGLGSNFSDEFTIDDKNNVKIYEKKYNFSKVVESLKPIFSKGFANSQIMHINFPIKMKTLSGNHFGSIFPMQKERKKFFDSDILGRIGNFKKISIIDSSVFTSLPARPPTLTVMANSLRISTETRKNNFFKL